uniref:Metallothionein n=1 Tax=Russula atropurpurea TaxID=152952 RepID=U6BIU3_9AGAM|nr:metallothionein [Russula atropurpurea]UZH91458.1 metallothionein 1 [Russula bresadolae]
MACNCSQNCSSCGDSSNNSCQCASGTCQCSSCVNHTHSASCGCRS